MAEIIREKLLWNLEREIPHGTAVEITKFSERDNGVIDVDATIYCEKASHKGIIIGKNGAMLKKISTAAREDCERFMGTKVFLQTWVKVKENWRDSQTTCIRNFGYRYNFAHKSWLRYPFRARCPFAERPEHNDDRRPSLDR